MIYDGVIIGGGAGGLMCAMRAAELDKNVLLLEASERMGKKLLATGNGRCNISNVNINAGCYNTDFVIPIISKIDAQTLISYFEERGLKTRNEGGRIYPYSNGAASVLDFFRLKSEGFTRCGYEVKTLEKKEYGFLINGEIMTRKVVLASGSVAGGGRAEYNLYTPFGHRITAISPSLVNFITDTKYIKPLDGTRAKCAVKLILDGTVIMREEGEVQFKNDGIGGIAVMNLSSRIARQKQAQYYAAIDFVPDMEAQEARRFPLSGLVKRVIAEAVEKQAADRGEDVYYTLKSFLISVNGLGTMKNAQTVSGGLEVKGFDAETLESKIQKGLYAVGEVLDVDGLCGGYNLHWAFAGGLVTAENL